MKTCIVLLAALLYANAASAKIFSFIYIEANEGDSSGGHVAVQFAGEVFHYQYSDGFIRLFRQNAEDFRFDYRVLQNRPLHVADIEVSEQTFDLLHDRFKLSFFEQERQFRRLEAARQDIRLLAWLSRIREGGIAKTATVSGQSIKLPGVGLFFDNSDLSRGREPSEDCAAASNAVLSLLRKLLEQQYGADFLRRRTAELLNAVRRLSVAEKTVDKESDYNFSARYTDLATALLAIQTLQEAQPLTAGVCHVLAAPEWRLDKQKIQALEGFRGRLRRSVLKLAEAQRPDWGYGLFIAMARLIAVEQSLRSGYWTFLDDFADDSSIISSGDFKRFPERLRILQADAESGWREQWSSLPDEIDERHYSRLEMAANRYREWALSEIRYSLRYRGEQPLPVKAGYLPNPLLPDLPLQQLKGGLREREWYAEELALQLEQAYAYSLLARNCVTEVLRNINDALGAETAQRLGGKIDADLNIVPFTAFAAVRSTYHVANVAVLPSYRQMLMARQYADGFAPLVYAREANVFSATDYDANAQDAWFVFFTDDALLLRPLYGAFNSAAGLAQSLAGLVRWPFDGGKQLAAGARGLLMSLPELAFVNLRKGSYKYLSPHGNSLIELSR